MLRRILGVLFAAVLLLPVSGAGQAASAPGAPTRVPVTVVLVERLPVPGSTVRRAAAPRCRAAGRDPASGQRRRHAVLRSRADASRRPAGGRRHASDGGHDASPPATRA